MFYYMIERELLRYQNEEGQTITKTGYFYGKTKEEAEYKYRNYLKASSHDTADMENTTHRILEL